jgi:hypothetical protein
MIARLRTWWAASPRARRLPSALALPLIAVVFGGMAALGADDWIQWVFAGFALLGGGLGIYTTVLVLTGRDAL